MERVSCSAVLASFFKLISAYSASRRRMFDKVPILSILN